MKEEQILNGNVAICKFMGEDYLFNYSKGVLPRHQFKLEGVVETKYHESWDWLLPVFHKFCQLAELVAEMPRTRISFCTDFIQGIWSQDISISYKSITDGIDWYNKHSTIQNSH